MNLAIFDLDNTLLDGDSDYNWGLFLAREGFVNQKSHQEMNEKFYADYNAGKVKAVVCAACHGADGNSQVTIYPKLAGQYKNYLINTLSSYKSGSRKNAIMNGFAAGLSDQDIEDL